jgi:lipoate-protein ligase A
MRSKAGTIEVYFEVKKGKIEGIRFFGDYFGQEDSAELEAKLTGVEHNEETLRKLLGELKVERYFGDVDAEELLGMMF